MTGVTILSGTVFNQLIVWNVPEEQPSGDNDNNEGRQIVARYFHNTICIRIRVYCNISSAMFNQDESLIERKKIVDGGGLIPIVLIYIYIK